LDHLPLIDTHCHLDFQKFDPDRPDVLQRARQAGVKRILIPGVTLDSSREVVKLADGDPMLFVAVGVHPTEAGSWTESTGRDLQSLIETVPPPKVSAIGEIGLDYYWEAAPHELQQAVLKEQLDLASKMELPVVLHFREKGGAPDGPCAADLLTILDAWVAGMRNEANPLARRPGVLHSFAGSLSSAERAISLDFLLGVGGPVTYSRKRQEIISSLPLESLLIETDAPFLTPAPLQGRRNEPANVALIADKIAALHSCDREVVAAVTSANAARLFGWDD
jgi:TatD DNase family protein